MDTTASDRRAVELGKRVKNLTTRQAQTETGLAQGRAEIAEATARRSKFVAELVGADAATTGFLEDEIDHLDREILSHVRFVESAQIVLSEIAAETDPLRAELAELERVIREKQREKDLEAFKLKYTERLQRAGGEIDAARRSLNALNELQQEAKEECGGAADNFVTGLLEEFRIRQHNPERHGWRRKIANHGMFSFQITPMSDGKG